ncbi:unnamed protein product, partial [Ectocarpus fasciculatus]
MVRKQCRPAPEKHPHKTQILEREELWPPEPPRETLRYCTAAYPSRIQVTFEPSLGSSNLVPCCSLATHPDKKNPGLTDSMRQARRRIAHVDMHSPCAHSPDVRRTSTDK